MDGSSFESLIEITLWRQIFDSNPVVLEELILELLNKAMDSRLLTPKFWKDLKVYVQLGKQIKEDNSFVSFSKLEGLDGFAILVSRTGFQKEETSILPILEGLVYDSIFPVGHTFEGSPAEEYGEYISKLVLDNRNEFLNLFSKVKSPVLSRRFLNLLEYKGLLLLIKEKHKRDGLSISVTQLERIVRIYGVREQGKIEIFLRAWLVFLFHSATSQLSAAKLVGEVGTLILEEGLLDKMNLDLSKSFVSLSSLFKWTEAEKNYFFGLGQSWTNESASILLASELAEEDTMLAYFRQGKDPFLRQMKGSGFFTIWLNLFFGTSRHRAFACQRRPPAYLGAHGSRRHDLPVRPARMLPLPRSEILPRHRPRLATHQAREKTGHSPRRVVRPRDQAAPCFSQPIPRPALERPLAPPPHRTKRHRANRHAHLRDHPLPRDPPPSPNRSDR
jgi:hypothetical protein